MNGPSIQVSLDGGTTWQDAPEGVRVSVQYRHADPDANLDIDFNFTHEGIITDVWRGEELEHNETEAEMYDDIDARLR